MFLFPSGRVSLVGAELLIAQVFEGFPFAPSLLEDLFCCWSCRFCQRRSSPSASCCAVGEARPALPRAKAQFGGGGAGGQLFGCMIHECAFPDPFIDLVKAMAHFGHLLVGCAQAEFLL